MAGVTVSHGFGMVWYGLVWYGMVWYGMAGVTVSHGFAEILSPIRDTTHPLEVGR